MKGIRYVVCLCFAVAIVALAIYFTGADFLIFVDLPSLFVVFGISVPMLRTGWTFGEMAGAFKAALGEGGGARELDSAAQFFGAATRYLLLSGLAGWFLGLIGILSNLEDVSKLGPNAAVALVTMLYAVVFPLAVSLPLGMLAKKRLSELERA